MDIVFLVLSLLTALLPLADKSVQYVQQAQQQQKAQLNTAAPHVVFHDGRWWKWDGQLWWVWTPPQQQLAGGLTNVVR